MSIGKALGLAAAGAAQMSSDLAEKKRAAEEAQRAAEEAQAAYDKSPRAHQEKMVATLSNRTPTSPMAQAAFEAYTETPAQQQSRAMGAAATEAGFGAHLQRNSSYYSRLQKRSQDLTPTYNPSFQ